jgi:hypothetical protein
VLDVFAGGAFAGWVVGFEAVVDGVFLAGFACALPGAGLAAVLVVVAVVACVLAVVATLAVLPELELEPPPQPAITMATPSAVTPSHMRFQIFKRFSLPQTYRRRSHNALCTF